MSNNSTGRETVPELIQSVFDKLTALAGDEPAPTELTPAVPIKKSITDDLPRTRPSRGGAARK